MAEIPELVVTLFCFDLIFDLNWLRSKIFMQSSTIRLWIWIRNLERNHLKNERSYTLSLFVSLSLSIYLDLSHRLSHSFTLYTVTLNISTVITTKFRIILLMLNVWNRYSRVQSWTIRIKKLLCNNESCVSNHILFNRWVLLLLLMLLLLFYYLFYFIFFLPFDNSVSSFD